MWAMGDVTSAFGERDHSISCVVYATESARPIYRDGSVTNERVREARPTATAICTSASEARC